MFTCTAPGDVQSGTKEVVFPGGRKGVAGGVVGHRGQVLALAVSSDGKFLVHWGEREREREREREGEGGGGGGGGGGRRREREREREGEREKRGRGRER